MQFLEIINTCKVLGKYTKKFNLTWQQMASLENCFFGHNVLFCSQKSDIMAENEENVRESGQINI